MARDLVRNAGSERQVRRAAKAETEQHDRRLEAFRAALSTEAGRTLIYEILLEARVYGTVWHDHGSRMAYNVGQQDFGHWVLAMALETDENLVAIMEREGRARAMRAMKASDAKPGDAEEEPDNEQQ